MISMDAKRLILTRLLPKTGQSIEVRAGDDGTHQAGWWKGLKYPNNRTRFITKNLEGNEVIIDRATGLMWAADGTSAGCYNSDSISWYDGLAYANALDFAGFTDWRVPNIRELCSIVNYSLHTPSISEPPFSNTYDGAYLSSTTWLMPTTFCYGVNFAFAQVTEQLKNGAIKLRCVRSGV